MYDDSIVFTSEALRHLAAEVGSDRVGMGTDDPFPWTSAQVDHMLTTPGLSDAERIAMLKGTAAKRLGPRTDGAIVRSRRWSLQNETIRTTRGGEPGSGAHRAGAFGRGGRDLLSYHGTP